MPALMPLLEGDPTLTLWQRAPEADVGNILPLLSERPVPVGKIAAALSLKVQSDALDVNISGLIKKVGDAPAQFEIIVNVADAPVRQRFTVAHEIGHFLLHRHLIDQEGIIDTILFRSNISSKFEVEANKVAASILLPWNNVRDWSDTHYGSMPNQQIISEIANAYRVSELTVGYRFGF